ncbi:MAG: S-layer homology domain-containing protein, partial [Oscillospiraceae bacterium]|nr:S-layer homology domain-containing protein [Oscillospiraceae bacterium]
MLGRMKRGICLLLVALMLFTSVPVVAFANSQLSEWAVEYVDRALERGLIPQHLQSQYTQPITRAEFAALAVTLYEFWSGEIIGRIPFDDTDDINVEKAAYIGVVNGVGDHRFAPDNQLTREQAATMLARLVDAMEEGIPDNPPTFVDNDI